MIISKERLLKEQRATNYRPEIIEKVVWLIHLLNSIAEDSFLKERLVLKGGTALNLFYFDLPRLSVDADLNYIGAIERESMLRERPLIEKQLIQIFSRMGLSLYRNPFAHAGGKMVWQYPSALGNKGNIEVDLNFMYRVPLLAAEKKSSIQLAGQQVHNLLILDFHELAAGKLSALIDRSAGRDFFDAYQLFQYPQLDIGKLRLCFVIYAAIHADRNFLNMDTNNINVDLKDLQNSLIPVLKKDFAHNFPSTLLWIKHLVEEVRLGLNKLLPFSPSEREFIQNIIQNAAIKPELITNEEVLLEKIKSHPALLWAIKKQAKN